MSKRSIKIKTLEEKLAANFNKKSQEPVKEIIPDYVNEDGPCSEGDPQDVPCENNISSIPDYLTIAKEYINTIIIPLFDYPSHLLNVTDLSEFAISLAALFEECKVTSVEDASRIKGIINSDLIHYNRNRGFVPHRTLLERLGMYKEINVDRKALRTSIDNCKAGIDKYKILKKEEKEKAIQEDNKLINNIIDSIKPKVEKYKNLEQRIIDSEEAYSLESSKDSRASCNNVIKDNISNTKKFLNNKSIDNNYEHVNHPSHYNNYDKEVIDMMEAIWGPEETAIFCKLNAFKYRLRMGTKPDNNIQQDLEKEKWYLNKYHELLKKINK